MIALKPILAAKIKILLILAKKSRKIAIKLTLKLELPSNTLWLIVGPNFTGSYKNKRAYWWKNYSVFSCQNK